MSNPGSCSEGMSVFLWCISTWQDSSRHRKPCTWWEVWLRSFFVAMRGGVSLAKRYHVGKCGVNAMRLFGLIKFKEHVVILVVFLSARV